MKNSQCLLVVALFAWPLQAAEHYPLDASNTQVSFAVEHLGIQWVTAHFSDIKGEFIVDRKGSSSRVDVSVGIASLTCSEPHWNERLLDELAQAMTDASICGLGQAAMNPLKSAYKYFREDLK